MDTPTTSKGTHTTNQRGDKEYRDTLKQRRNISPTLSVNNDQTVKQSSRSQSPQPSNTLRGRSTSPIPTNLLKQLNSIYSPLNTKLPKNPQGRNMEMQCGWCYHHNIQHNHTTPNCRLLQKAESADRWHITYRNRLCQKCLLPGHYWRECESSTPPCTECELPHNAILGCRPEEIISPHLQNQ